MMIPASRGWFAFTRGRFFPVKNADLESMEYFRYFVAKRRGIVFDVGGELGYEALQFSKMVGKKGKVYVFECFPPHVEKLKKIADKQKNISIIERACWNAQENIKFYTGYTPGSNTAIRDCTGQRGQELAHIDADQYIVPADTLDNLWVELTDRGKIDFLKMDIEGAELEALQGAKEMLKNTNKVVIAAYHRRHGQPTAKKVEKILIESGFWIITDDNLHVYGRRS